MDEGAMAFSKVLKYQSEWNKLADSINTRGSEMSDVEILNIKYFLKQLANEYYDMELLSKGIPEPEKATLAKSLGKEFRLKIRECDDAASKGDLAKIVGIYPSTAKLLNDFLVLLQDVPDEL